MRQVPDDRQSLAGSGRVIRAVTTGEDAPSRRRDFSKHVEQRGVDAICTSLIRTARDRLQELEGLRRRLEDEIRERWICARKDFERHEQDVRAEIDRRQQMATEAFDLAQDEAASAGRELGFEAGRKEGYEEGYRAGYDAGEREGIDAGRTEARSELAHLASAFTTAVRDVQGKFDDSFADLSSQVVLIAKEIARKILKHEIAHDSEVALRNVQSAVDLTFRRGDVVVQLHPDDAAAFREILSRKPRWIEGFEAIEVAECVDVDRGGCRVVSGTGIVDQSIGVQLELVTKAVEDALLQSTNVSAMAAGRVQGGVDAHDVGAENVVSKARRRHEDGRDLQRERWT